MLLLIYNQWVLKFRGFKNDLGFVVTDLYNLIMIWGDRDLGFIW